MLPLWGRCVMDEDAKTYRERAMHARLGAKEAIRPEFRIAFERVAESYEAMARDAERLSHSATDQADARNRRPADVLTRPDPRSDRPQYSPRAVGSTRSASGDTEYEDGPAPS